MKRTKENKIKTTHETRILRCELTDPELLMAGRAMAKAIDDKKNIEAEQESAKTMFKARLAAVDAEILAQQGKVRDKFEMRRVSVDLILDYTAVEAYAIRKDTNEEIDRRALTQEEKQMDMGFDETEKAAQEPAVI